MEYKKNTDGGFSKLPQKNVDFGGGLERITMAVNDCPDVIAINHRPILDCIEKASGKKYSQNENETRAFRVIADHMKAAVFLISDNVLPSNTDQGYFVRRIIRRGVRFADFLGIKASALSEVVEPIAEMYKDSYPEIMARSSMIKKEIDLEESKFRKTLESGLKEFEKGIDPFILFSTYGFPIELTKELAKEKGQTIDEVKFAEDLKKHQDLSRVGSEHKFKGGLGGTGEVELRYHTATHLLHQALRDVLGNNVQQKGSNITAERLRFDFVHSAKMTDDEKKRVEDIVNEKIMEKLPMNKVILPKAEAEKTGALHFFGDKYGDEVSVYYIGDSIEDAYSKEFCGGPHVKNTSELGHFKIVKEEAVSAGVRRIKAVLE
jgi:alanyl-tRNA synthetase